MKDKNTAFFYIGIMFSLFLTLVFAPITSLFIQILLFLATLLMAYNAYCMYKRVAYIKSDSPFEDFFTSK
ncbi:hypothetical protein [Kurthia sp. Dielmo]|uniref:hypothetical protein n=1 Tax=Kurthia sp. Dielmo TaxID=1033738 RepID=UPI0005CB891E|nr:hypothetical protein [Kurthia sp. Dielmo]